MSSLQARLLRRWLKRQNLFSGGDFSPIAMREGAERATGRNRPRRGVTASWVFLPRTDGNGPHAGAAPLSAEGSGSISAEWLIPAGATGGAAAGAPALLYLHGGAWFLGSANTHRPLTSRLAHASGLSTLVVNYRLAPENPFPAGLDDCRFAYEWLLAGGTPPERIVVGGDSAGGNLTLALLVALRDAGVPLPAAAFAISPATDLTYSLDSHRSRRHLDPYFHDMTPNTIVEGYTGGRDPREPLISPLFADLRGLPPLLIHVGDHELLLDDSVRFGERAAAAGVDVQVVVWPGMFHVFHLYAQLLPEARRAIAQIGEYVRARVGA